MTNALFSHALGRAKITPNDDIVAGSVGTWRLSYTAGEGGIAVGGGVKVYTDTDSDWGTPQFIDPTAAEYFTVESPNGVLAAVTSTGVKSIRIAIGGRNLEAGESITVTYGDTSGGGPGSRAQTFAEERRFFWVDVDTDGSGVWRTLADSPCKRVVADEPVLLRATAMPSTLAVGQTFRIVLKAEDRWGNPAGSFAGVVELEGEGFSCGPRSVEFAPEDNGVKWIDDVTADTPGVLRIKTRIAESSITSHKSPVTHPANPVVVVETDPEHQLWWADPHGGQLVHNEKFVDFFRYARDVSGVQFVGFQRNADVISADDWEKQQQAEREYTEEGRFIPIPGYEWSGRTWEGGHHNIYFRRHGQSAKRNLGVEEMFQAEREQSELAHIRDVYAEYRNTDAMITPHVGGEHSDISFHEPRLEPAVEISSTHGAFEWMLRDTIERGYRLGFLGGSDCYTGRPGDDRPGYQLRRYAKSGLTGIYAKGVTLDDFFEAMRARRVYATTGARMVLSFDTNQGTLGSEFTTEDPPAFSAAVAGTAPLDRFELYRGTELAYSHALGEDVSPNRVRILWNGSSRMTSYSGVLWDGVAKVSGAKIRDVEKIRFDSPRSQVGWAAPTTDAAEGIESSTVVGAAHPTSVTWHAWGCGYPQGIVLDLDDFVDPADVEIELRIDTRVITCPAYGKHGSEYPRRISFAPAEGTTVRMRLSEIQSDAVELPLGVLNRQVTIDPMPINRPLSADFQVLEDDPQPGFTPYWLRVIQLDGEVAWSSPIFVDYAGD